MRDHDDLAVTLAVVLVIGVVLIGRELVGLWPMVFLAYGPILLVYCGPTVLRWLAIGREVRRFRSELRRVP